MSITPDPETSSRQRGVVEALRSQDIARAIVLARDALAAGCETTLFLNLHAHGHEIEGRHAEALADLQRAHALDPKDIPILNALGLALARDHRAREAMTMFDEAIALAPGFAPAHFNKGWVSEDAGELDAARRCYLRASELDPACAAAPARLAALAARQGKADDARELATRALAADPRHPGARLALANADFQDGLLEPARERLSDLIGDPITPPFEHAEAQGLLGDVLDALGDAEAAFSAYEARNAAIRALNVPRFARPVGETMPEYLGWLTEHFERMPAWRPSPMSPDIEPRPLQHVFILGFPRSGTTLLEAVLDRHPAVVTTQERDALADGVRELMKSPESLDRLMELPEADCARHRRLYWRRLAEHGIEAQGKVLIDKQPYNTVKLPLIARLFPEARIVFNLRDPRDVVLSCFRRRFRMNPSNYELLTLDGAARLYDAIMRLAVLYRAKLPLAIRDMRYEAFVDDFEAEILVLCEFIALPWHDAMRDSAGPANRRAIVTPSAAQISQGLSKGGIGAWRRYAEELSSVLPILAPWVARLGYGAD